MNGLGGSGVFSHRIFGGSQPRDIIYYCGLQSEYNINNKGLQAQRLLEKIFALEQSTTHSLVQVYDLTSR